MSSSAIATAPRLYSTAIAWRRVLVYAVVGLVVVVAATLPRLALAVMAPNADQGLFVTIGEVIDRGGVVGRDTWDNKPPGAYYLYAAVLRFAPDYSQTCTIHNSRLPDGEHQLQCAQLVLSVFDAVYAIALSAAVGWIARRRFGRLAGGLAAVLCAVFSGMLQVLNGGGNPDFFALLPSTLSVAMALRYAESSRTRWLVAAGVCAGAATLFKQTAIVPLVGIAVWLIYARQPRMLGALIAGAAIPLGLTAAFLALAGALPDVVNQAVLFNRSYVVDATNVRGLLQQAVIQTARIGFGSQAGLWVAAAGGVLLLRAQPNRRVNALILAWTLASLLSLALGGAHLFDYYYLWLIPAFSVCGGLGLARAWQANRATGRAWLAIAALTLLAYSSQYQFQQYGNAWYSRLQSTTYIPEEFVAGAIRGGHGSLFVWGNGAQVYALSGRVPASRYLHTLALSYDYARHTELDADRAELMRTLTAAPPAVIAIDTPSLRRNDTLDFPELKAFVAAEYTLANAPSNPIFEGWEIYKRVNPPAD